MPRLSRSYRKRSSSRERSKNLKKRRSRSRSTERNRRSRSRDRSRRSRSRDKKRSRSRDRKDKESKDKSKRRRSRSTDRDKDHSKSKDSHSHSHAHRSRKSHTPERKIAHREGAITVKDEPISKEEEQKHLEEEMQKRRERIEKWRQERKKQQELVPINIAMPTKQWTLEDEDDDDEEEEAKNNGGDPDEEVDPLDAYMQSVNEEVKPVGPDKQDADAIDKVQFVTAIVKKKVDPSKTKGELMESNADAMEYSSEEEEEDLDMLMMAKKKKELNLVDHDKIYYAPYRKNFYVEVPEIANMTAEEAEVLRAEMEGIKVRGKNCPKPIRTWAQCGVNKKILDAMKKHSYERPTPIQAQAIPAIMSGRDLIGIAKTGSGKTLGFVLPMLRHIMDQPPIDEGDGPVAVIMTPTRELALQISTECRKFTKPLAMHVVCVYGGTGISEQIAELKRGCEIIVCTPGRMIDMLSANSGRVTNLRRCTYIVLDEADRMFDMGFEPQVMRIMDNVRPDRQTVMFSATFPRQMEALARRILNKPIEVQVGGRSVVCKEVTQNVIVIEEDKKLFKLLELLGNLSDEGSTLVFVDKQENADEVMKQLMKHAYPCMALHGGIDQYDRDSTINDFKNGVFKIMVATSVAARGLDVKHLNLVVNYDCPNHYEDYVHRCGRTGRAGNKGFAYTFITPEQERYTGEIIRAMELSESPVPPDLAKLWNDYKEKAKAEGRSIKSASGFKGKGFKFDEMEAQLADDRRKVQKAALGLHDSDDEDAGMDIEQKIEDMFASRKRVTDVAKPMPGQPQMMNMPNMQNLPGLPPQMNQGLMGPLPPFTFNFGPIPLVVQQQTGGKLELAKRLAAKINMQRNLGPDAPDITQLAAASIMKGGNIAAPQVASKTIAEQKAEKINAKLGYRPPSDEMEESETPAETFKRYEEELDINDFPQTARWKVTSKDALGQICEYSEAGITVRGTYIPPGKEPKEGERRLYLAIEATSELAISKAKKEITRLIKEELVRLQNSYQPINKGRYKVL
ncbi:probable ATP-dependent RNA helicase DDX46 isoform X2 [Littorina saxatilis]|uniref:probable ATP-dependent RNA helicase DDX46 isoform X2 n=1 Tax=Littorina saxatilis TaxID=31220 RepID=UPI0038B43EC0